MKALMEPSPDIARVVGRLKRAQGFEDGLAEAEGEILGRTWAEETATVRHLRELAIDAGMEPWVRWRPSDYNSIWIALEGVEGRFAGRERNVVDWRHAAYTRGVLRGAGAVYEQVRELI